MVELADTPGSGSGGRTPVRVQIPLAAIVKRQNGDLPVLFFCVKQFIWHYYRAGYSFSITSMNFSMGCAPKSSCFSLITILGTELTLYFTASGGNIPVSIMSALIWLFSSARRWAVLTAPGQNGQVSETSTWICTSLPILVIRSMMFCGRG